MPLIPYLMMRGLPLHRGVVLELWRSKSLTRLLLSTLVFVHRLLSAPEAERSFVACLRGELRPFRVATSNATRLGDVGTSTLLLQSTVASGVLAEERDGLVGACRWAKAVGAKGSAREQDPVGVPGAGRPRLDQRRLRPLRGAVCCW